ncbi:MAG: metallophosphoesterase [Bacteroidales bacterium]|nr:metallophosphoesterase [Bacteroidales bacterium]
MKKIFVIALAALALTCCSRHGQLTIIHLNDTHSHFEPLRSGADDGRGGVIERAAFIDSMRTARGKDNVLLLHAGDFSQGTTYFSELDGDLEIEALNTLGYDVVTLGNHEFDKGLEDLGRRLAALNCPVVVCNYDFSPFEAGKYITPYTILKRGGLKVGVIGVLCNLKSVVSAATADRVPEFDTVPTVQKWADFLKDEEHCDLVIALTHIGFELSHDDPMIDPVLCSQTRNIDLFVGGHSHTFMDEPAMIENIDGKPIPVVQDGCWGLWTGVMEVKY